MDALCSIQCILHQLSYRCVQALPRLCWRGERGLVIEQEASCTSANTLELDQQNAHIVEASDVPVIREKLSGALLFQYIVL